MAAKTTVRVAITNNAAKDDAFNGDSLSWLSEGGSLSGSLNVLANDPGAARLYAVSGSAPISSTAQVPQTLTSTFAVTYDGHTYTGLLTVNADGTVGFDLSSLSGHLDSLADNETVDVTFYYTAQMANGAMSTARVTVSLTGENDPPVASVEQIGNVYEDGDLILGHVDATDVDHGAQLSYSLISDAPAGFSFSSDGSYSFDPSDQAYQHLPAGVAEQHTLTYQVIDQYGAASQSTITFTVIGTNDPAAITGDNAGGVTEDGAQSDSGTLVVADVDDGEAGTAAYSQTDTLGTFAVDEAGNWTFAIDNDAAQSLGATESEVLNYTVTSIDGTASETVSITVQGTNDPVVIDLDASDVAASVSEGDDNNAARSDSGVIVFSDVDVNDVQTLSVDTNGTLGTATVDQDGTWHYTVNDSGTVDALAAGDHASDSFTVLIDDGHGGSVLQLVEVDIVGTNDAATFGGTASGDVYEDGVGGPASLAGALTVSDVDTGQNSFTADTISGSYGSLTIDAAGNWSYALDSRADALDTGNNPVETFTVASLDGTTTSVTVTVHGHTDAPATDSDTTNDHDDTTAVNSAGVSSPGNPYQTNGTAGADTIVGMNDASQGDTINAQNGGDLVYGRAGNDTIQGQGGSDTIYGGSGDDRITGTGGSDVLWGGSGNDTFVYGANSDSAGGSADTIADFHHDFDRIDLSAIDAAAAPGNQAFAFSAVAAANSVWQVGNDIFADTNGDTTADLTIHLGGTPGTLSAGDFVL